eukprot:6744254-Lingulodinium_polyedra.AAC.1
MTYSSDETQLKCFSSVAFSSSSAAKRPPKAKRVEGVLVQQVFCDIWTWPGWCGRPLSSGNLYP